MWGPISDRILPILKIFWDLDFLGIVNTLPPPPLPPANPILGTERPPGGCRPTGGEASSGASEGG